MTLPRHPRTAADERTMGPEAAHTLPTPDDEVMPNTPRPAAWAGVALTVASAVLVALAFPPARLRVLAWIGLAPFFVALRRARTVQAVGFAVLWLVVFAALVGLWFPTAI